MSLLKKAHAKAQRRKVTREKNLRTRGILSFFTAAIIDNDFYFNGMMFDDAAIDNVEDYFYNAGARFRRITGRRVTYNSASIRKMTEGARNSASLIELIRTQGHGEDFDGNYVGPEEILENFYTRLNELDQYADYLDNEHGGEIYIPGEAW